MKKEELLLTLYDETGAMLLKNRLASIPLKEESIIGQSIEIYNDPEPCMIHRSAVMSRMYMEMLEYFLGALKAGRSSHLYGTLPVKIYSYFGIAHIYKIEASLQFNF